MQFRITVIIVALIFGISHAQADSAYPNLIIQGSTGASNIQTNANMNINGATSNNDITNKVNGGSSSANGNGAGNTTSFDQVRQSPSVFMNTPAPTAPCQATAGGFVTFIAGGGFAASYTLEECEIRESARIAHGVGQAQMAKEIMCMGKFAKLTLSCKGE